MNISKMITGVAVLACLSALGSTQLLGCIVKGREITSKHECLKHEKKCSWISHPGYCEIRKGLHDYYKECERMTIEPACKHRDHCLWRKESGFCVNDRKKENKNEKNLSTKLPKKS